jgi:tetraacyldisaccharide 4'-kinase
MKSLVLPPLSALYEAIIRSRTALYERGTFRRSKLPRPVISVGNITTGGTGKTPLVEWVSRLLANHGKTVCILTRGYGRKNSGQRVLVSDGTQVFADPSEAGDEPFLLATSLLGAAAVISDADRFAAGQGAIKHLSTNCFVLDDGFQHLQLARDLNIITVDATDPWGGRQMLPYGRLREPLTGLKRADCVVLTRCEQVEDPAPILTEAAQLTGGRPVFKSTTHTRRIAPLADRTSDLEPLTPVAAFCAVGNPDSFFTHLKRDGSEPIFKKSFRDHHVYSQDDVSKLVNSAKQAGARSLITTAKDAVKLRGFNFEIPCYSVEVTLHIENETELTRMILKSAMSDML